MRLQDALIGLAFCVAATTPAIAASFDCKKAASTVEKTICADQALSELDEHLSRYYAVALDTMPDAASCLKADQRAWVKSERNACGSDAGCLTKIYLHRLSELDGVQPGASAIRNIELPAGPTLVTVIPPEAEGSKSASGKPANFEGSLLHESEDMNNMGLAVRGKDGKPHAFVLDMNIGNSPSHQTLQALIDGKDKSRYQVRGLLSHDGELAEGDCRFVYRLP